MIKWLYSDRAKLKKLLLEIADKEFYDEKISDEDIEILHTIQELNNKKSTEANIKNFFSVLHCLIDYATFKGL